MTVSRAPRLANEASRMVDYVSQLLDHSPREHTMIVTRSYTETSPATAQARITRIRISARARRTAELQRRLSISRALRAA